MLSVSLPRLGHARARDVSYVLGVCALRPVHLDPGTRLLRSPRGRARQGLHRLQRRRGLHVSTLLSTFTTIRWPYCSVLTVYIYLSYSAAIPRALRALPKSMCYALYFYIQYLQIIGAFVSFDDAGDTTCTICRQGMTRREKKTLAERYADKYKDLHVHQNLTRVMYFT